MPMTKLLGVLDSGCLPVPAGQPRSCLVNFWLNFAKSPKHAQNHALVALIVAISLLNTQIDFLSKLDKNWLSHE